jgi:hypothetical protein
MKLIISNKSDFARFKYILGVGNRIVPSLRLVIGIHSRSVFALDAKDILIEKGRTTHSACLLDNADLACMDRQLLNTNIINEDDP